MIPDLPDGMSESNRLDFYDTLSGNLTDQSTIHVHWWTHRQNPSVCWICDMVTLLSKILELSKPINTKSPVDIETQYSSEEDSDPEIEDNLNHNDEIPNEPEYDVVDEGEQD